MHDNASPRELTNRQLRSTLASYRLHLKHLPKSNHEGRAVLESEIEKIEEELRRRDAMSREDEYD